MDFIWAIIGKCNISFDSLYKLSLSDLNKIADGKNADNRENWEMTRDLAFWTVKGWAKKKHLKKTDVMRFPWDVKKELTKEKIIEIRTNGATLRELWKTGKILFKAK